MNLFRMFKVSFALGVVMFMISCGKDDTPAAKSRDIRIEVSGSFSGNVSASYVNANGGGATESIPSLPWTKNIVYASTVPSMAISVGATGGVAGQTLLIKVFAGGTLVSETPGVANSSGQLVITSPTYIF